MLTSTVYRKPTHTDRYLHFKSHHPNHVKRGVVRCLYQRARRVTNMSENLKEEEKHLHKVLQSNGYDNTTIRAGSKELPSKDHKDTEQEKGLILTIPYITGLSESIQRVCRDLYIKPAFTKVKILYPLPPTRRLEQRVVEHQMLVREVMRRFQPLLNMLGSSITPLSRKR